MHAPAILAHSPAVVRPRSTLHQHHLSPTSFADTLQSMHEIHDTDSYACSDDEVGKCTGPSHWSEQESAHCQGQCQIIEQVSGASKRNFRLQLWTIPSQTSIACCVTNQMYRKVSEKRCPDSSIQQSPYSQQRRDCRPRDKGMQGVGPKDGCSVLHCRRRLPACPGKFGMVCISIPPAHACNPWTIIVS